MHDDNLAYSVANLFITLSILPVPLELLVKEYSLYTALKINDAVARYVSHLSVYNDIYLKECGSYPSACLR